MVRRLLLFAALLFGIFTMHTVGHPATPAMPAMPGMAATADIGPAPPMTAHGTVHARPVLPSAAESPSPGHDRHPQPAHSMDPLSVCVAVLGAWSTALLAALGLALGLADTGAAAALAALRERLAGTPRPIPPPRISLSLVRLSVSRI
ncbi:hypothetical protein ACWGCW_16980 [Streptomyces sp. NPDC054933]